MGIKKEQVYLHILLLTSLVIFSLPRKCLAVPAAPLAHTLTQPDGSTFQARQWGDESIHGWETIDGYSIVFDQDLQCWTYAEHDIAGRLTSSAKIAGKYPPPADFPRHLRPTGEFSSMSHRKRAPQEVSPEFISSIGTAKIPVFLIKFSDTITIPTHTTDEFNSLLFGTGNNTMNDYFKEVSYNAFSISGTVTGWYTASNTHDYYGQNNALTGFDMYPATLVTEAVAAADAAGFNFVPYDQDGDCYVDVVAIIHEGTGAEASRYPSDIWSHSWDLYSAHYYNDQDGNGIYTTKCPCSKGGFIKVNDYIIMPEKLSNQISTIGIFAHEYGHALGLPDLYDTDSSSQGIGYWSVMASGSWNGVWINGDRPAHMDAWCKYYLGWVTPTLVTGTLPNEPINQAETYADVYQLLSGSPSSSIGEYFLVENRQKAGFDTGLPGSGLLIWHIDESQNSNANECYPSLLYNCNSLRHYHVALEQADNLWELEKRINSGNSGDPYPGSANNRSFNDTSSPSSNLYSGSPSNVSVTSISDSGTTMIATLSAISTCTYSISPASRSFDASGGASGISVSTTAGCTWTATSNASWISITSGDSGTGSGTVNFFVSANTGTSSRTGTMIVAGQTFTVNQMGGSTCTYSISPESQSFEAGGGTGSVTVTAPAECAWTATSNDSWITIDSGSSGYGNGIVQYSVPAHTSTDSRTGTMTIAEKTFTVTQQGIVECSNWSDVIAKYNSYVSGQVLWSDVIGCYTKYTAQ
jgi:M6 family metalloprotease-like protein